MSDALTQLQKRLPRKLATAIADARELGRRAFEDSQDTYEFLRKLVELLAEHEATQSDLQDTIDGIDTTVIGAVPTTRTISTNSPLTGGGDLSADRTLAINDGTTSQKGAVQLEDSTSSTSTTKASTPNSVKSAYDLAGAHHTRHESGGGDAIKLDDLAAPDDNTDLDASTTKHGLAPKGSGTVTKFWRTDWTEASPSGSAAGFETKLSGNTSIDADHSVVVSDTVDTNGFSLELADGAALEVIGGGQPGIWHPDVVPGSPSIYDDEFTGVSLDGKWSTWDPAPVISGTNAPFIDTRRQCLIIRPVIGNAATRWCGIYQAAPIAPEYVVYAKANLVAPLGNSTASGIFIAQDLVGAATTADFVVCEQNINSTAAAGGNAVRSWTAYNGTATGTIVTTPIIAPWLRLRVSGTTINGDISHDGTEWVNVTSRTLTTPLYFGFGIDNQTTSLLAQAELYYFRVFVGPGVSNQLSCPQLGGFL